MTRIIRASVLMIKRPTFCPNHSTTGGGVRTGRTAARGFSPAAAARHPKFPSLRICALSGIVGCSHAFLFLVSFLIRWSRSTFICP